MPRADVDEKDVYFPLSLQLPWPEFESQEVGVEDSVIGLPEAAQRLGIPYQTAHRLVLVGQLPAQKLAGRWFVSRAAVEKLARQTGKDRPNAAEGGEGVA